MPSPIVTKKRPANRILLYVLAFGALAWFIYPRGENGWFTSLGLLGIFSIAGAAVALIRVSRLRNFVVRHSRRIEVFALAPVFISAAYLFANGFIFRHLPKLYQSWDNVAGYFFAWVMTIGIAMVFVPGAALQRKALLEWEATRRPGPIVDGG